MVLIAALTASLLAGIEQIPEVPTSFKTTASVELASGVPSLSDTALRDALTDADLSPRVIDDVVEQNRGRPSRRNGHCPRRPRPARDIAPAVHRPPTRPTASGRGRRSGRGPSRTHPVTPVRHEASLLSGGSSLYPTPDSAPHPPGADDLYNRHSRVGNSLSQVTMRSWIVPGVETLTPAKAGGARGSVTRCCCRLDDEVTAMDLHPAAPHRPREPVPAELHAPRWCA